MNLEEIIRHDPQIATVKEKPYASIFILVASAICAQLSTTLHKNENMGFAMTLFATAIAMWGLKGILWPKKHFLHKASKEILIRKEFYFDSAYMDKVKQCLSSHTPVQCLQKLKTLPQNGAMTIRVIIYVTPSGSYMKHQIQRYIPYEYVPL
jgi:hypothetical protein